MCSKTKSAFYFLLSATVLNRLWDVWAAPVDAPIEGDGPASDSAVPMVLQEVPYGDTVTLLCRSNDRSHNFLYWHVNGKNTIVGPGNNFDDFKFKYEVLSGNLTIKSVSKAEEGVYNCVSRGVRKNDFNIRSVRMVVRKDWEEVYEHDPGVNLFRTVVVIAILSVLAAVGYIAYRTWKDRYRHPSYLVPSDDEEDDSGEEIFRAPGAPRPTGNIVLNNTNDNFDSPGISTDFKSILDTANNK